MNCGLRLRNHEQAWCFVRCRRNRQSTGRSIALLNSSNNATLSCATIQRTGSYVTARAVFRNTILGSILLRQEDGSSDSAPTRVSADLFFNGIEGSSSSLQWRIVMEDNCSALFPPYNPNGAAGPCAENSQAGCAVGNLTAKLGNIIVGPEKGTQRWTRLDLNLPLSGPHSVVGKTIQLVAPGDNRPRDCAVITAYVQRTGVATFDQQGVSGSITFTQPSPFDPTVTQVALANLRSMAGGYHVHKWPVPQRVQSEQSLCSGGSVSGHFNPFSVVQDETYPAPAESTGDLYEIGDLSGKYGSLASFDEINKTHTDYNLPLFGRHSVLGRSIVIHKSDGSRWVCATIRDPSAVIYALATFKFPVIGFVLFQQRRVDGQDTSVYVQLDCADGSTAITQDHALNVHENPVCSDWLSSNETNRCLSSGAIFNTISSLAAGQSPHCNPSNPELCLTGDLSSKHGVVSVRSQGSPSRTFFTDTGLNLHGIHSIIGKSMVLSGAGGSNNRLACANIQELHPRQAEVAHWTGIGSVTLSQNTWIIQGPTSIDIHLHSVHRNQLQYDISAAPKAYQGTYHCNSPGDVYNPFNITTAAKTESTKDELKVGDLSGKFGILVGPRASRKDLDPTLDLMGPRSVVGRTLRLLTMSGKNLACGTIQDRTEDGGRDISAVATFTGDVVGRITLKQHVYPDDTLSHTSVVMTVKKASGPQTRQHNWHVHQNRVGDDANATVGRCVSTGGHYNPFMVNVRDNYAECHPGNQLRCEVGDQSKKLGQLTMDGDIALETDVNLPLVGPFSVMGRSIVIHAENAGAPRIACADILPDPQTAVFHDLYVTSSRPLNRSDATEVLSTALNTTRENVLVSVLNNRHHAECVGVRVFFLGSDGANLKQKFTNLVETKPDEFGVYRPCDEELTTGKDVVCSQGRNSKVLTFTGEKVKVKNPCAYTLADMRCGNYDVLVTARADLGNSFRYTPEHIKVDVTSRANKGQRWKGETSLDDLKEFLRQVNKTTPGVRCVERTTRLSMPALTASRGQRFVSDELETFRVEMIAVPSKARLIVRCRDLQQAKSYPQSLCHSPEGSKKAVAERKNKLGLEEKSQAVFLDILRDQEIKQTKQCRSFRKIISGCSNDTLAVSSCDALISSPRVLSTFPDQAEGWFKRCLKSFCKKKGKRCRALKSVIETEVSKLSAKDAKEIRRLLSNLNCDELD